MKIKLFLLISLLYSTFIFAQIPSIEWQKKYGGTDYDQALDVKQTNDGGYILVGSTQSFNGDVSGNHGANDIWVIKLGSNGTLQWQKSIGGTGSEEANSIVQTTDGGYIIGGWTGSTNGDVVETNGGFDYWVIKLNSIGEIQWQKTYGGTQYEYINDIQQTSDGGYIIAGFTSSDNGDIIDFHGGSTDCWLIKLDSLGTIQWQKTLGGTNSDYATSIQQTTDGGYIVAGYTYSNDWDVTFNHGLNDYWVIKLNSLGNIQWQKTYGGTSNDQASCIRQTADGGYIVTGNTESNNGDITGFHGSMDFWIVKLNSIGTIQWQKALGGSNYDEAYNIELANNGEYILTGRVASTNWNVTGNHGGFDFWVVKLTNSGNIKWQKTLGGSQYDQSYRVQQTNDGGYIVVGWSASIDGDTTNSNSQGSADVWVVKLATDNLATQDFTAKKTFIVYPNPAHDVLNIQTTNNIDKIMVTDLSGKKLQEENDNFKQINLQSLQNGIYMLQIISDGEITSKRIIKK